MNTKTGKKFFSTRCFFLLFFLIINLQGIKTVCAQDNKKAQKWFEEAKKEYSLQSYPQAVDLCRKILDRDPGFVDARLLLADIYFALDSTQLEIIQLEKAAQQSDLPQINYRLGNAYFNTGNYESAKKVLKIYAETPGLSQNRKTEIERLLESCRFAAEAVKHPVDFDPVRLPDNVNSVNDEYWPNLSIDQKKLVFTRLIKNPGSRPQEDFFISEFDSAGWGRAQPIVEINTPENEGAQIVSADGRLLFFTACNRRNGRGSCDIYYSRWQGGSWTVPRNAGAINSRYWEAQPGFSSDGRFLYFSSNRLGGKGKKDIWRAELLDFDQNGVATWKKPVNLGPEINTEGNEISPFIHPNNRNFYFASDFHTGMGGLDVFVSEIENDSVFSAPGNLGYPINTFHNEQGLFISPNGRTAYFASERNQDTGLDIYSFNLDESLRPEPVTYVHAVIADAKTSKPVQAQLELVNLTDEKRSVRKETTGANGEALLCLPVGDRYGFSVSKEGYLFFSESFALDEPKNVYEPYDLFIRLQPVEVGSEMNLYNVYFETDSFSILRESEPELQKLVEFLQKNSGLKVEIQGHTDNSGGNEKNQVLSELRARSVVDYLVKNGIGKNRLHAAGYGETRPVATNETEEGRRQNRRTTIKITEK